LHNTSPQETVKTYLFSSILDSKYQGSELGLGLLTEDQKLCQNVAGVTEYNSL